MTVLALAAVMGLSTADRSTVGASAPLLHTVLGFSSTQIGVLASAAAFTGAAATVPAGFLADRVRRVMLLRTSVAGWVAAIAAVGCCTSFAAMTVARVALGIVTAVATPVIASLIGDLVPVAKRGRVYSRLLLGELVGAGVGLIVSGEIAGLVGWRWAYWWLILPSATLAVVLSRVPEPTRTGTAGTPRGPGPGAGNGPGSGCGIDPGPDPDPDVERADGEAPPAVSARLSPWQTVRAVFTIRTNVVLVVASTLGYFFFAGIQTFGVTYLRQRYGLSQSTVPLLFVVIGGGAVAGVVAGGRFGDRLRRRGHPSGRIVAVLVAYFGATAAFVPSLLVPSLLWGLPLLAVGAGFLGAANPPLDAARIDVVPHRLLGRAEGLRSLLRNSADASAPAAFGVVTGHLGLRSTLLVMSSTMLAGGLVGTAAVRSYPGDAERADAPTAPAPA